MADKQPLREQVKRHLEHPKLDQQTTDALLQQLQPPPRLVQRLKPLLASVAAALLVFGAWTASMYPDTTTRHQVPPRMVEEVIMNHLHLRQMEVLTTNFDTLTSSMEKLNFVPVPPDGLSPLTLVGGRYCTLKGVLATQLLFESADGTTVTMFQTAYDPSRFGKLPRREDNEASVRVNERGVQVEVWVEQGVVMAKAQSRS